MGLGWLWRYIDGRRACAFVCILVPCLFSPASFLPLLPLPSLSDLLSGIYGELGVGEERIDRDDRERVGLLYIVHFFFPDSRNENGYKRSTSRLLSRLDLRLNTVRMTVKRSCAQFDRKSPAGNKEGTKEAVK